MGKNQILVLFKHTNARTHIHTHTERERESMVEEGERAKNERRNQGKRDIKMAQDGNKLKF